MVGPCGKRTVIPGGTRRPEAKPFRVQKKILTIDNRKQIDLCLSCKREICRFGSCAAVKAAGPLKRAERLKRRMELYLAGWDDKRIAAEMNVTEDTVRAWRKKLSLPKNRKGAGAIV